MNQSASNGQTAGILSAIISYTIWGFLPLYWKILGQISAGEILAHRIVWSFIFMLMVIFIAKKLQHFWKDLKGLWSNRKRLIAITSASIIISFNWVLYIWAVNTDQVIEASLGYYINPLFSILLGIFVLKEKLSFWQMVSFVLAAIGVMYLTFHFGTIPWIALLLAGSFALYGLIKKMVNLGAMSGLAIETMFITPIALIFLSFFHINGNGAFGRDITETLLLMGAGVATAVPLLLFASGAKKIPLSMIGLLQYIAPTLMLIIGVYFYNEPFTKYHLIAFICIWSALAIYYFSKSKLFTSIETKIVTHKKRHSA